MARQVSTARNDQRAHSRPSAPGVATGQASVPARAARAHAAARERNSVLGPMYVAPAFVLYSLFVLVPFGYALYLSFYSWSGAGSQTYVGLHNYAKVFTQPQLTESFVHAAVLLVFFSVIPIALGLLLTGLMTNVRIRGLTLYRTVLFLPQVLSLVALAVVWEWILGYDGPLNAILRGVDLGSLAQDWLGSFTWALPAVGIMGSWVGYGFAMVLFMAGAEKIPITLYNAASIDGAGRIRQFLTVTLPGLRNEITVVAVLTITSTLTSFDIIYVMTDGGPGTSTVLPAFQVFTFAFNDYEVGTAAATGVVLAILVFVIAVIIMRFRRSD